MKITKQTGTILVFVILALILLRQQYHRLLIGSCSRITIARATHTSGGGGRNSFNLNYKFSYNGKFYDSNAMLNYTDYIQKGESYFLNRRYFVKFYCHDPSISELDLDKTVPDTIVKIPSNGWDRLPVQE